jgi:hypothetical protein
MMKRMAIMLRSSQLYKKTTTKRLKTFLCIFLHLLCLPPRFSSFLCLFVLFCFVFC